MSYTMFNEVCIYEAKLNIIDEIEERMRKLKNFIINKSVIEVHARVSKLGVEKFLRDGIVA